MWPSGPMFIVKYIYIICVYIYAIAHATLHCLGHSPAGRPAKLLARPGREFLLADEQEQDHA